MQQEQIIKANDLDFTKEDQQSVNQFSKLYMQYKEKQKQLSAKSDYVSAQEDALTDLEMCNDDEQVRMKYGDCFFHVSVDHSKTTIQQHSEQDKKELSELSETSQELDKKMKKLKAVLYAKFGQSINLEED